MKSIFILLISLFLLAGCGSDSTNDKKECSPVCETWQTCDTTDGTCVLTEGKCEATSDCTDGKICNTTTHTCEVEATTCNPVCDTWETCNTTSLVCELNAGKCNSNTDCTTAGETCNLTTHTCLTEKTGQQIFQETCSKCHALPNPANFTKAEITDELNNHKLRGRINLSETDYNKLSEYLNSLAQ